MKNPGPLGNLPSLQDLTQQAQAQQAQRVILAADQYSEAAPFIATPDNGWLVCRRFMIERTPAGVELPEAARGCYWEVMSVGYGPVVQSGDRVEVVYEPGDIILVHGQAVAQMYEGITLFFVQMTSVLCKIEKRSVSS